MKEVFLKTILIVDDDKTHRHMLRTLLVRKAGYSILEAGNGVEALDIIKKDQARTVSVVILDLSMPQMGGMEALNRIKQIRSTLPVIILTANQDLHDAVEAMKQGAMDFLNKPVQHERLLVSIRNALRLGDLSEEVSRLSRQREGTVHFSDLVGFDGGLEKTVKIARKASASDIPVLITGETGAGKELLARAIHGESNRAGGAFIAVNCGAIPSQLVESTLFGHEKGAFTGAVEKTAGKFREADQGTIFLDEVGELPLETQVKLLRVLQQNEVEPVGAGRSVPVDVRVISATNRTLEKEVEEGRFREDLFFRLNVLPVHIPSLSQRKEDIPALLDFFVKKYAAQESKFFNDLRPEERQVLIERPWPGNIRELENAVHRAVVLAEPEEFGAFLSQGYVPEQHADGDFINPIRRDGVLKSMDDIEQEAMKFAVHFHSGNVTKAAKSLNIAKSTFYRKYNN